MSNKIDNVFYLKLGQKLDLKRKMLGYSYRYLAKLTGISSTQLQRYLSAQLRMTNDTYEIICRALELNSDLDVEIVMG